MESTVPVIELDEDEVREQPVITLDDTEDDPDSNEVPVVTLEDDVDNEPPIISLDDDKIQDDLDVIFNERNAGNLSVEEIICDGASKVSKFNDSVQNSKNVIMIDDSGHDSIVASSSETAIDCDTSVEFKVDVDAPSDVLKLISNSKKKLQVCKKCHKMFSTVQRLNGHICTDTPKKRFQCCTCHELFSDQNELSKHTKTHNDGKPYVCDICFKNFSDKKTLRMHYNTHTGEKPFACNICDKVFPNTLSLKNHYEMHIGEKPYVCDVCLESFDRKTSLCNHKLEEHQFLTVI